jgi:hypothetical protein
VVSHEPSADPPFCTAHRSGSEPIRRRQPRRSQPCTNSGSRQVAESTYSITTRSMQACRVGSRYCQLICQADRTKVSEVSWLASFAAGLSKLLQPTRLLLSPDLCRLAQPSAGCLLQPTCMGNSSLGPEESTGLSVTRRTQTEVNLFLIKSYGRR